jgi:amino acid adenylation domain-containing protein
MDTKTLSAGTTVLDLINAMVAASPQDVAVKDVDGTVTYAELSDRADRIAARLSEAGVAPGDLVGLCVERSASLVVAALGILRAASAYVAMDPSYPEERLSWMLGDSAPAAILSNGTTAARLGHAGQITVSGGGRLAPGPEAEVATPPTARPGPHDLAYVVYTSGSSGRPKGAMADHAGLLNLVEWHRRAFELGPADRCTQIASPGFDAAVWEIWAALATGAAIHVVPESLRRDPVGLRDWLVAEGITVTFLPTAVVEGVLGLTWQKDVALRYVLTGGDGLTSRPPADLGFTLVNNYGVSEATVVATSGFVSPTGGGAPSIGRAIDGVVAKIVDENLEPVEPGASGELVIGGVAVGPGYLNRPDLTAERFVEDARGRRLYRTGDAARIGADEEIEFLGRLDEQLSIRGFRVEAGEVAAALKAHPDVEDGVAMASGTRSAQRQLVAYVVAADRRPEDDQLSEFLGRSLPEYMVPARYIWLDRMPVTAHGKIDRNALPDLGQAGPPDAGEPKGGAPGSEVHAVIASIVAELLEMPEVGIDQNFFLLGGHSMMGAQLILQLRERFGVEVSLRYLFDHPTPAELAVEVERRIEEAGPGAEAVATAKAVS